MINLDDMVRDFGEQTRNEILGHTRFQIENFIINAQPTDYGRYKQCVAEIRSRIKQREMAKAEIDKLRGLLNTTGAGLKRIAELEILLEDVEREMYILGDVYDALRGRIDLSRRDELEREYWDAKFEHELLMHWLVGAPLSPSFAQNVLCLPDGSRAKNKLLSQLSIKQVDFRHNNLIEENVEHGGSKDTPVEV